MRVRGAAGLAVLALALASCGGSGSKASSTSTTRPAGTTTTAAPKAAATTSTTTPRSTAPPADAGTALLAKQAVMTQADFGAPWKVYAKAKPELPLPADDCDESRGTPAARLGAGAGITGEELQFGTLPIYVGGSSYVFPDEATAKAYIVAHHAPAGIECRRKQLEAQEASGKGKGVFTVTVASTTSPQIGQGGFEATVTYDVMRAGTGGAKPTVAATFQRDVYRVGRVVMLVGIDTGGYSGPDQGGTVATAVQKALTAVYGRIGNG